MQVQKEERKDEMDKQAPVRLSESDEGLRTVHLFRLNGDIFQTSSSRPIVSAVAKGLNVRIIMSDFNNNTIVIISYEILDGGVLCSPWSALGSIISVCETPQWLRGF